MNTNTTIDLVACACPGLFALLFTTCCGIDSAVCIHGSPHTREQWRRGFEM